jgi:hypothetical protein
MRHGVSPPANHGRSRRRPKFGGLRIERGVGPHVTGPVATRLMLTLSSAVLGG